MNTQQPTTGRLFSFALGYFINRHLYSVEEHRQSVTITKWFFFQWACKYERALKMVSLYRIAHPNAHCSHSLIYNGNFPSNNIKRVFFIHFHFLMRWINLMREIEENQHLSIIHYNENIHNQLQCISCVHNFAFT